MHRFMNIKFTKHVVVDMLNILTIVFLLRKT